MHHVIKKQVFNLSLETEQDVFYLQHRVSNYNQREIVLVLQKVFDEMCADGQSIYIDKLEIDLGDISVKEIQNDQWAGLFEARLRHQLKKISNVNERGRSVVLE